MNDLEVATTAGATTTAEAAAAGTAAATEVAAAGAAAESEATAVGGLAAARVGVLRSAAAIAPRPRKSDAERGGTLVVPSRSAAGARIRPGTPERSGQRV